MANVLFTRKNASEIPNVPIIDGQLIFDTSGNGKMYLDNGTERLEMGGALTVDATLSKTSTNPVQNKAVAGVMLDTLSDIDNVTSKGFLPDALAIKELNSSLEWINKPYTKIYSSNTIDEHPTKINMDLSQYNEFMLAVENRGILYACTVIPKTFIDKTFRASTNSDTTLAQMKLETDGFTVWRIMPDEFYYLSVYAR